MEQLRAFRVGERYTNDQIRFALNVGNLGGIRPAVDAQRNLRHIVIITAAEAPDRSLAENPYHDRIEGDVLLYTAQGREGDQQLAGANKRLLEQYGVSVPIYGFMATGQQTYRFVGLLELLRHYQETQIDRRGNTRQVWLFEFRIHNAPQIVPLDQAAAISAAIIAESRARSALVDLEREVAPDLGDDLQQDATQVESVRRHLLQIPAYNFEHLIKALLETSGLVDVTVTPFSGDGGVDINGYVDEANDLFAGTHVQAQAKRWRHAVGNAEINSFRGALSVTAKGAFITTSHYTRAAVVEARHPTKPSIALIDGPRLSSMVIRMGVDVSAFQ